MTWERVGRLQRGESTATQHTTLKWKTNNNIGRRGHTDNERQKIGQLILAYIMPSKYFLKILRKASWHVKSKRGTSWFNVQRSTSNVGRWKSNTSIQYRTCEHKKKITIRHDRAAREERKGNAPIDTAGGARPAGVRWSREP